MVALHHPAVRLRLTGFDDLPFVARVIKLETVLVETDTTVTRRRGKGREGEGRGGRGGGRRGSQLTGFRGSSTSRMLRFSSGMIPRGSLSCGRRALSQPPPAPAEGPATRPRGRAAPHLPCTYRRVFKVIEAVVGEDEPAPLPGLHAPP